MCETNAESNVRCLKLRRAAPSIGEYGFSITRSKWDPYPWICEVALGTPASICGLKVGDCLLKINDVDIVGLKNEAIAQLVYSQADSVTIVCWNSGHKIDCDKNSICCAPLPVSLRRLANAVDNMLRVIECPVCTSTIAPPALQCQNGHLLCLDCRVRSEKCPICRGYFTPIRAAAAEEIYAIIVNAFETCQSGHKLRNRIFGKMTFANAITCSQCVVHEAKQPSKLLPKCKLFRAQRRSSLERMWQAKPATLLQVEAATKSNFILPDDT